MPLPTATPGARRCRTRVLVTRCWPNFDHHLGFFHNPFYRCNLQWRFDPGDGRARSYPCFVGVFRKETLPPEPPPQRANWWKRGKGSPRFFPSFPSITTISTDYHHFHRLPPFPPITTISTDYHHLLTLARGTGFLTRPTICDASGLPTIAAGCQTLPDAATRCHTVPGPASATHDPGGRRHRQHRTSWYSWWVSPRQAVGLPKRPDGPLAAPVP
jgi:hypothetical protein